MRRALLAALALAAVSAPVALALAQQPGAGPPKLGFPLACSIGRSCEVQHYFDRDPGPGMADYHCGRRSEPQHNGIDIRLVDLAQMHRGVDVLAEAAGVVRAVRDGVPDNVIGQPIPKTQQCGNRVAIDHGGGWLTDYCHLEHGTLKVKLGEVVRAGQPIAQVGLSGGTEFPHLHVSIQHVATFVDPFAPAPGANPACSPADPLWTPQALREMPYKAGAVLVAGLAGQPVGQPGIETGGVAPFAPADPVLTLYTRLIGLEAGDQIELALAGPGGVSLVDRRLAPLPRDRDQTDVALSHGRPAAGWPHGSYAGVVRVWRGGKMVIERRTASPPI